MYPRLSAQSVLQKILVNFWNDVYFIIEAAYNIFGHWFYKLTIILPSFGYAWPSLIPVAIISIWYSKK